MKKINKDFITNKLISADEDLVKAKRFNKVFIYFLHHPNIGSFIIYGLFYPSFLFLFITSVLDLLLLFSKFIFEPLLIYEEILFEEIDLRKNGSNNLISNNK